jgi:hypothetical protein
MKTIPFAGAAFVCLAVCSAATAQPETVTVETDKLAGLWRIGMPMGGTIDWRMNVTFGPMRDTFCRLEGPRGALKAYCLMQLAYKSDVGDVSLEGDHVHIAWGSMMLRVTADGTMQPAGGFTGYYTLKASGIGIRAPEQMTAAKISLAQDAPDPGGKSASLTRVLAGLAAGTPLASLTQLWGKPEPPTADELRGLGAIQTVAWLGHTPTKDELLAAFPPDKRGKEAARVNDYVLDIYAVGVANGERICGVHQRPDAVIDGLVCN